MDLAADRGPTGGATTLVDLLVLGYVELSLAKQRGLVPPNWVVPAGTDWGVDPDGTST
jgi:hypothetical protein